MQCAKCKWWTISRFAVNYEISNQYGSCDRYGPGEVAIEGDAYVKEYTTDALAFCSEFSERTADTKVQNGQIAQQTK